MFEHMFESVKHPRGRACRRPGRGGWPGREVGMDPAALIIFIIAVLIVAAIALGAARRRR
jgi:hypothetical protein